ncbi:hypothetical protein R1flu_017780 [Riccia fluitans]|uniref:Uncharacterized protein n=1 Tax=Riccia fluitans TaxID=41844 RepID=A0ABD1ZDX8_9MARC
MSDFPPKIFLDDNDAESEADVLLGTLDRSNIDLGMETDEERQLTMSSKTVETRYKINKWTGVCNFALWSCQMQDKLIVQGQVRSLLDERLESMREDQWMDLSSRVCSEIRLHLNDDI